MRLLRASAVAILDGIAGARAVVAGGEHTCALVGEREVRCWGWNHDRQLGDGTDFDRRAPVSVVEP